jgi:hypothetical protein
MMRGRTLGLAIIALLALSAVVATAAQAEEPFWKVAGKRLGEGETKEVSIKATKSFVLKAGTATVTCTEASVKKGGHIVGSKEATAGGNVNIVIVSKCSVSGNGTGCKVEKEEITTTEELDTLAFNTAKTLLDDYFIPKSGSVFATIHFEGAECGVKTAKVEGSTAAEVLSGGKAVEVGKEPAEATTLELVFPKTQIKTVIVNGKETSVGLKAFGFAATFEGAASMELVSKEVFGAYTK